MPTKTTPAKAKAKGRPKAVGTVPIYTRVRGKDLPTIRRLAKAANTTPANYCRIVLEDHIDRRREHEAAEKAKLAAK